MELASVRESGYSSNKDIIIKKVNSLSLDNFRKFHNQELKLGGVVTVLVGKNGTMKSTILGMLGEVFSSDQKDIHEATLKVSMNDIFNWSNSKDTQNYDYKIQIETDKAERIIEPVQHRFRKEDKRHRIIVSGSQKGQGQFLLPVSYLSLKRLYPLINSDKRSDGGYIFSEKENDIIKKFFQRVLNRADFDNFAEYDASVSKSHKYPFGPSGADSVYDIESISSGEDNLGTFANQILSLEKIKKDASLTGLLLIDEFDATLHPVSQIALFDYIYKWAHKANVQVILTTHSLFLIQKILLGGEYFEAIQTGNICVNLITTLYEEPNELSVINGTNYEKAYEELTLNRLNPETIKAKIIVEDEVAEKFISTFISPNKRKYISFVHNLDESEDNTGTGTNVLKSLVKNFKVLLNETNSLVIFDPDMGENYVQEITRGINSYKNVLCFPAINNENLQTFEVELLMWLLDIHDNDNLFIKKLKKSKESMLNDISSHGISISKNDYCDGENHSNKGKLWYKGLSSGEKRTLLTSYKNQRLEEPVIKDFLRKIDNFVKLTFEKNGIKIPSEFD